MRPKDLAKMIDSVTDGWKAAMNMHFISASADEVIAEIEVSDVHRQPLGIVHGGVYAGMIEASSSVGATLHAMADGGKYAIGLDNHTSFLHAVREGKLRVTARPVTRGRRTHLWEANVVSGDRVVTTGRVRLIVIERGALVGGEAAELHVE
jgi:uncharacterized protein (TIGR00369 family)